MFFNSFWLLLFSVLSLLSSALTLIGAFRPPCLYRFGKRLLVRLAGGVCRWVPFRGSSRGGESERGRIEPGFVEGSLTFWSHFAQHWSSKNSAQKSVEKMMPTCSPKGAPNELKIIKNCIRRVSWERSECENKLKE